MYEDVTYEEILKRMLDRVQVMLTKGKGQSSMMHWLQPRWKSN